MTRTALDRILVAVCALYVADLAVSIAAAVTGFATVDKVSGPVMIIFGFVAVGFAVRAARHPGLDQRTRRGWRVVAGAFVLALATPVLFLLVTGDRPFPQPGDGTHLAFAGATEQCRQAAAPVDDREQRRDIVGKLPYAGIALGYALMAVTAFREPRAYPWQGLVLGGMIITGVVVLRQSLSQRESDEAAATDTLTGLANRGQLHAVLARALERAARSGHRCAVLLIDLNGFKQINDTQGHQVGDGLLVGVAEVMRRCVRGSGLVGRLGGDEFAVVLPMIGRAQDADAVAQRIIDALAEPMVVRDQPLQASASIGAAVCEPGELTPDALLHRADAAMYAAKRGRSARAALWTPALEDAGR